MLTFFCDQVPLTARKASIFSLKHFFFGKNHTFECQLYADLPLILILSVYTDFLTFKFGKIQIPPPPPPLRLDEIQIFSVMPKVFHYTLLIHKDFFPENTDFYGP